MTGLDPRSPLFKALTFDEVLQITGRSRRSVKRWIDRKLLAQYGKGADARFNEDEVVELEQKMAAAARANRERIRERNHQAAAARTAGDPST